MKTLILLGMAFLCLFTNSLYAQVSNDDCSTAMSLGYAYNGLGSPPPLCYINSATNVSGNIYSFGNNSAALPNFPYPNINTALTCEGYSPSVSSPSKDLWYKIDAVACDLYLSITAYDTLHVSMWFSDNTNGCNALFPKKCYTLLPNTVTTDTFFAPDRRVYFQMTGGNSLDSTAFDMCFGSFIACPSFYSHNTPTPTICSERNIDIIHPTVGNNGAIDINMKNGNPPYQFSWNDSSTDSSRTGLSSGTYIVSITDNVGCISTDTIVLVDQVTHQQKIASHKDQIIVFPTLTNDNISFTKRNTGLYRILIYNNVGQLVKQVLFPDQKITISIKDLPKGIYFAQIQNRLSNPLTTHKILKI